MTRERFMSVMAERREAKRKGYVIELEYLTRTAWQYYFAIRRVPVRQWGELLAGRGL